MASFPGTVGRPVAPRARSPAAHLVRLYDQAARLAKLGAWECDLATQELTWTDGVYDLFELPKSVALRRAAILDLYVDESRETMERMRAEAIRSGQGFVLDAEIRTWRGKARWMRLSVDVGREDGRVVRIFGAKQDITRERDAWEQIRNLAERDPLTGLANRRVFDTRYRAMIDDPAAHDVAALARIDLDHLKRINDGHGHAAGDECLRQTAMRLRHALGDALLLARIGGDEFAVLFRKPLARARLRAKLQRAAEAAGRPVFWDGRFLDVGISIGAAILDRPHRRKCSAVFAEADEALYAAKAAGRRRVHLFGDGLGDPPPDHRFHTYGDNGRRMDLLAKDQIVQ